MRVNVKAIHKGDELYSLPFNLLHRVICGGYDVDTIQEIDLWVLRIAYSIADNIATSNFVINYESNSKENLYTSK